MTFGKELIQSVKEAIAIADGQAKPAAVFLPETIDVAAANDKKGTREFAFVRSEKYKPNE